jgi:hypothetical protein
MLNGGLFARCRRRVQNLKCVVVSVFIMGSCEDGRYVFIAVVTYADIRFTNPLNPEAYSNSVYKLVFLSDKGQSF